MAYETSGWLDVPTQELRQKLRGTEEYNLGVDLKRATKEELVAAYMQYQQMVKDGIIDKQEHERKIAADVEQTLRLAETQPRRSRNAAEDAELVASLPVPVPGRKSSEGAGGMTPTVGTAAPRTKQLKFNTRCGGRLVNCFFRLFFVSPSFPRVASTVLSLLLFLTQFFSRRAAHPLCCAVPCGVVPCGVVPCGMVPCGMVWCGVQAGGHGACATSDAQKRFEAGHILWRRPAVA